MKRIKAVTFFLLTLLTLPALSLAQELCSATPGNAPGDIVQYYVRFWDFGNHDFWPYSAVNGAWVIPWPDQYGGVVYLPDNPGDHGDRCYNECWPVQFTARTYNVRLSAGARGGNPSGWKCSIVGWVIGHESGPIKAEKKARALRNADIFEGWAAGFGMVAAISCEVIPEPYTCAGSATGAATSVVVAWGFKRIAERDPWNPDFLSINFPPPLRSVEELGLTWTDDYYQNQMVGDTLGIIQMIDFILEEVDKYESCHTADVDCLAYGVDHAAAIDSVIRWYIPWYMNDMANNAWTVAYIAEANGGAPEAVQALRDYAQTLASEAGGFQE